MEYPKRSSAKGRSKQLAFILLAQLVFVSTTLVSILFFYFPDQIVEGTYAVLLLSTVTAALPYIKAFARLPVSTMSRFVLFVDRYIVSLIALSAGLLLASIIWGTLMFGDFIDRFRYVRHIQQAVSSSNLEAVSLPDPQVLAEAYSMFPNRREAALLLVRSSRIFHHGDKFRTFVRFQRSFVEALDVEAVAKRAVSEDIPGNSGLNGLRFLASVVAEAFGIPRDQTPEALEETRKRLLWAINLLEKQNKQALEAAIEALLLKVVVESNGAPGLFDLDASFSSINDKIANAAVGDVGNLYQSHAYQQLLDMEAIRWIDRAATDPTSEEDNSVKKAMANFRRVLMLRDAIPRSGEVSWIATPGKLVLYHLFMARSGATTSITEAEVLGSDAYGVVEEELERLLASPAFRDFHHPRTWYRGTPLDQGLNGQALQARVNAWLREDW